MRGQQKENLSKIKSMLKSDRFATELLNDAELSDELLTKVEPMKNLKNVSLKAHTKKGTNAPLPPNYSSVESARGAVPDRYSRYELETLFGGRQLKDYGVLAGLRDGIKMNNNNKDLLTIGRLVNIKRPQPQ